ncbi:MAG: tRNA pseudouridine(38-40) synthase TruA [Deltaproteobacteria bacterium]|nr:tRNA pseudouridine(38-40) synthase TruA [Deltaproteobacteria bacterium]
MVVAYDGTDYHGWQIQPGVKTVESVLKEAIEKVVDHPVRLVAAARTDAGVHAVGQVINFRTETKIPPENILKGVNTFLPYDIRVTNCLEVDPTFNARKFAKSKTYVYVILNSKTISPFFFRYTWHVPYQLDVGFMNTLAGYLVGRKDFSTFKKKGELYRKTEREIIRARVKRRGEFVYFIFEGTGFMRYMVRNIVGTLFLGGTKKITEEDFIKILESGDRDMAGPTAPARGLFLKKISYDGYTLVPRNQIFTSL